MSPTERNWAGSLAYAAADVIAPTSVDELAAVLSCADRARPLGTRHSFNDIADTTGTLILTEQLPAEIEIDTERRVVRVSGGCRYGDLARDLHRHGWALANLASLPHISVAGAVATGTHGSGDEIGSLAGAVVAVELIRPDGGFVTLRRGDPDFDGAVVSLGALGVVTHVELDIVPTFDVAQTVYEGVTWDAVLSDLSAITGLGYSVSMFTTWLDPDLVDMLWVKRRVGDAYGALPEVLDVRPADGPRHPVPGMPTQHCTDQMGVSDAWLHRLPHFRLDITPSSGAELQSEFFVPRSRAVEALHALRGLAGTLAPITQICEVRTIAAEGLWLSPAYGRDTVAFHFTWHPDRAGVAAVLPALDAALEPNEVRPHWGKVFDMSTYADRMPTLFRRWPDFRALRERYDPRGVLYNAMMDRLGF